METKTVRLEARQNPRSRLSNNKNITLARELDMLIAICRVSWKCDLRNLHRQGSFLSSYLRLLHECLRVISALRRKPHFRLRLIGSATSLRDSSCSIVIACRVSYHRYVQISLCKGLHRKCKKKMFLQK